MSKPVIYVAGPYSSAPGACTNEAIQVADTLWPLCWPLVPHLSHLWDAVCPRPYSDWIALDLALLARCDGVVRIAGESTGADREVEEARMRGLPILTIEPASFWAPMASDWFAKHFPQETF